MVCRALCLVIMVLLYQVYVDGSTPCAVNSREEK